jgi:hypothetical protein
MYLQKLHLPPEGREVPQQKQDELLSIGGMTCGGAGTRHLDF